MSTQTVSYDPAMTFEEIGTVLGISTNRAYQLYQSALTKLRNRPHLLRRMAELAPNAVDCRPLPEPAPLPVPQVAPRAPRTYRCMRVGAPLRSRTTRLIDHVAARTQIAANLLTAPERGSRRVSQARRMVIYILRHECLLSLPQIGILVGGQHHSTVLYSLRKFEQEMAKDLGLSDAVEEIRLAMRAAERRKAQ